MEKEKEKIEKEIKVALKKYNHNILSLKKFTGGTYLNYIDFKNENDEENNLIENENIFLLRRIEYLEKLLNDN